MISGRRHLRISRVLCLGIVCLLVSAEKQHYDGYKLISVLTKTLEQITKLTALEQDKAYQLDFWTEVRLFSRTDIMVSPEHFSRVTSLLRRWGLTVRTPQYDIQRLMDEEGVTTNEDGTTISPRYAEDAMIDLSLLKSLFRPSPIGRYMTYDEMLSWLSHLRTSFPGLVKLQNIGVTHENRTIRMIKIGSPLKCENSLFRWVFGQLFVPKPIIFIEAGLHAREWLAPAVAVYIINHLLTNYNTDTAVKSLVDSYDWYILPVANPDGYAYTHSTNRLWRKNRSVVANSTCIGTDLNRNFDADWGGLHSRQNPCNSLYAGTSAFSEKESKAIRDVLISAGAHMHAYFSLHAYSQFIFLPWGYTSSKKPPDYPEMLDIGISGRDALRAVHNTSFRVGTPGELLYSASGISSDWAKLAGGVKWAYSFELRPTPGSYGFLMPPSQIIPCAEETLAAIKAMVEAIRV